LICPTAVLCRRVCDGRPGRNSFSRGRAVRRRSVSVLSRYGHPGTWACSAFARSRGGIPADPRITSMSEIDPNTPGNGPRAPLPTAERPPDLDTLVRGLERMVRDGLPATEETADLTLLSLRGVWARSIDPDEILSRVKAINALLRELIPRIPPYRGKDWALAASILFKIAPATSRLNLS